jgi:hypothetical protein
MHCYQKVTEINKQGTAENFLRLMAPLILLL